MIKKMKIEISESDVKPLHFVEVFLPTDTDNPPEVVIDHHEKYLHVFLSSEGRPNVEFVGEPSRLEKFEDMIFGEYLFTDFQELNHGLRRNVKK